MKINQTNHLNYLKLIEELEEKIVKNYIGKVDEWKKHLKILAGNLSSIMLIHGFVPRLFKQKFEDFEHYYGYFCLILFGLSIFLFAYQRIKWFKMKYSKIY